MTAQKSCRNGLIQNLSEKDVQGLKEMYQMLFDLKRKLEETPLQKTEAAELNSDWLSGGFMENSKVETFTYDMFKSELMSDIMVDHPDNFMVRFLRARKHDSKAGFKMFYNSIKFFHNQGFQDIIHTGESELLQYPLESGLIYYYGHDLEGNVILYLTPRLHNPRDSPVEDFYKIILHIMAQGNLLLENKKVTVVIDLDGLSLGNVEYANVMFAADILANNFPEVLSRVLMFNAPWVFSGIWSVIENFFDPVVLDKIQFCSQEDLQKFIAKDQLPVRFGGSNLYEYDYKTPSKAQTALKLQDAEFNRLKVERKVLAYAFLIKSQEWLDGKPVEAERDELAQMLSDNFRALAPYTWSPSYYHRNGFIQNFDDVHF